MSVSLTISNSYIFCVVYFKSTAAVTLSHYFVIKIPICIKTNISDIYNNFFLHTYFTGPTRDGALVNDMMQPPHI